MEPIIFVPNRRVIWNIYHCPWLYPISLGKGWSTSHAHSSTHLVVSSAIGLINWCIHYVCVYVCVRDITAMQTEPSPHTMMLVYLQIIHMVEVFMCVIVERVLTLLMAHRSAASIKELWQKPKDHGSEIQRCQRQWGCGGSLLELRMWEVPVASIHNCVSWLPVVQMVGYGHLRAPYDVILSILMESDPV